jgi:transcriptional regulator with XRE-family HTH domain
VDRYGLSNDIRKMEEIVFLQKNLRYLRKAQGLTQEDLALKLGTRRSLIGSYEEGRGVPKLEMIRRMADLFGLPWMRFFQPTWQTAGKGKGLRLRD